MLEAYIIADRLRPYRTIQRGVSLVTTFLDVVLQGARIEGFQKFEAAK